MPIVSFGPGGEKQKQPNKQSCYFNGMLQFFLLRFYGFRFGLPAFDKSVISEAIWGALRGNLY